MSCMQVSKLGRVVLMLCTCSGLRQSTNDVGHRLVILIKNFRAIYNVTREIRAEKNGSDPGNAREEKAMQRYYVGILRMIERDPPPRVYQKWPPAFLQALTEVVGVTVVCLVKVAPNVMTLVVVAKFSVSCVFVGVGRVTVLV